MAVSNIKIGVLEYFISHSIGVGSKLCFVSHCREFCKMVRKIYIYSSEEVKTMSTISKLTGSSLEGEGTTILSSDSGA